MGVDKTTAPVNDLTTKMTHMTPAPRSVYLYTADDEACMSYRVDLMSLVLRLVSGALSVPQFRDRYYEFYLEEVPDDAMSDRDYEFFGKLQEKLDWTGPCPSDEERAWGWIDYAEYIAWAKGELYKYESDSG